MPGTEKKKAQDRERMQAKRRAERERVAALEAELVRLNRLAIDRLYFMDAYHTMLGETGLKVANMWKDKRVTRVHHSWGPEAHKLTGEQRAAHILDWEFAPRTLITDVDGHLSQHPSSKAQKDISDE